MQLTQGNRSRFMFSIWHGLRFGELSLTAQERHVIGEVVERYSLFNDEGVDKELFESAIKKIVESKPHLIDICEKLETIELRNSSRDNKKRHYWLNNPIDKQLELNQALLDFTSKPVGELDLKFHTFRVLRHLKANTISDILNQGLKRISKVRNCGKSTIQDLQRELIRYDLKLK